MASMVIRRRAQIALLLFLGFALGACAGGSDTPKRGRGASPTPPPTSTLLALPGDVMVLVPAGEFVMGASQEQLDVVPEFGFSPEWMEHLDLVIQGAAPPHTVYLDAFEIDVHEVTNAQYGRFVNSARKGAPGVPYRPASNPSRKPGGRSSWHDAVAFCAWAGKRLPTEAEWEKAARGVDRYEYPWGNGWDPSKLRSSDGVSGRDLENFGAWSNWIDGINASSSTPGPAAVGSHPEGASPYGVMDMAGNVWEWVADWFDAGYYQVSPERNPTGSQDGPT